MSQLKLLDRRAREVGQIKLGKMVPTSRGGSRPSKLDWFELTKRNAQGEWVRDEEIHKILGPTPTSIKVVFFSAKVEDVFHSELALYRKKTGGRFCAGDQLDAKLRLFMGDAIAFNDEGMLCCNRNTLVDGRNSFVFEAARPITIPQAAYEAMLDDMPELERKQVDDRDMHFWQCKTQKVWLDHIGCESHGCPLVHSDNPKCQCKPKGLLRVMLMDAPSFGAHHVLRTGSWNSIQSVLATLEMVVERVGSLEGIPFNLKCQHENIQTREGKNQKVTVAHLEVIGTLSTMLELASDHASRRLQLGRTQAALAPPKPIEDEVSDQDEDFAPEFRPDLPDEVEDAVAEIIEDGPSLEDDMNQERPTMENEGLGPEDMAGQAQHPHSVQTSDDAPHQQTPAPEDEVQAAPEVPEFDL